MTCEANWPAVRLKEVWKTFTSRAEQVSALKGVSMELDYGEITIIMGPSGAGKTTLLKTIYGLLPPDRGVVEVNGVDIYRLSGSARDRFISQLIGYMPQEDRLIETLNVQENLILPLLAIGESEKTASNRVKTILNVIGLNKLAERLPKELSMGQRRKVLLARALINDPEILLLDEPTANLDSDGVNWLLSYLELLKSEEDTCILLASHDQRVLEIADQIYWMLDGSLKKLKMEINQSYNQKP
ncbi:ABC transporter ATP-binding protein [Candidatus Bathyarchaeota archaeon]|nr:MAG: ABC transporter ATP-binding protein [Candidatus Bathyarchaeota archaeon]